MSTQPVEDIRIVRLTEATASEAKSIIRIVWKEHFAGHSDKYVRSFFESDTALQDLDDFEDVYHKNGGLALVVVNRETVVGTGALLRLTDDSCEIRRMFLLREYRGRGLGRQLAEILMEYARGQSYKRVRLGTNNKLAESHVLYRRLGFIEIPAYERGGDEYAYYMERSL